MKIHDSHLHRRRFICGMLGGGATALGVGVALPVVPYAGNLRQEPLPPFMVLEPPDYDLEPGTSRILMYGHIPVLLLKTPAPGSRLKVFVATCTHFDCTVSYKADENRIFCACHEGYYDLEGRVISGPPPRPLRPFFSRYHEDRLIIALEEENLQRAAETAAG
ncbi:MAG TPA: plastoquinol--plastocyanin reductase [Planctomycetes bacterium]|nr:plastoquinol--plastocyanin reductase [Planctomycetota bacterium]